MQNQPQSNDLGFEWTEVSLLRGTLSEFEARLNSRIKVPPRRLTEYFSWSDKAIKTEALHVTRILKRFAEAVVDSMENPASAGEFLQELDLKAISRDHDWRAIFMEIKEQTSEYEGHKRALLIKYLQYLSFRRKLLEFLYSRKTGLEETAEHLGVASSLSRESPEGTRCEPAGREAMLYHPGSRGLVRLSLGEPVEILFPEELKVDLMLAGHLFRLVGSKTPCLIDQNGVMYFLKEGRNMVGRHPESDVVIDPDFRDISRAHMIIEWDGDTALSITDLSTKGTFVPQQYTSARLLNKAKSPASED